MMADVYRAVYYTQMGEAILADCGHDHRGPKTARKCALLSKGSYNAVGKQVKDYWVVSPLEEAPDAR